MRYILFALLFLHFACGVQSIDRTLSRRIDITGDGSPEIFSLHVKGKDFYAPLDWTLKVKSGGSILYEYQEAGKASEVRVNLEVEGGADYRSVKTKFFFEDFVELEVTTEIRFGGGPDYLFNRGYDGSVYAVGSKYLIEECGLELEKATRIIERIADQLKSGDLMIVSHSQGGLYSSLPMVYVEEVNRLVPIYSS